MTTSSLNIEMRHKANILQRKLNTDVINMSIDVNKNKSGSSTLAPLHIFENSERHRGGMPESMPKYHIAPNFHGTIFS